MCFWTWHVHCVVLLNIHLDCRHSRANIVKNVEDPNLPSLALDQVTHHLMRRANYKVNRRYLMEMLDVIIFQQTKIVQAMKTCHLVVEIINLLPFDSLLSIFFLEYFFD